MIKLTDSQTRNLARLNETNGTMDMVNGVNQLKGFNSTALNGLVKKGLVTKLTGHTRNPDRRATRRDRANGYKVGQLVESYTTTVTYTLFGA